MWLVLWASETFTIDLNPLFSDYLSFLFTTLNGNKSGSVHIIPSMSSVPHLLFVP